MSESEALARKAASERLLAAEGVKFIAHLPGIESAEEVTLRSTAEIVDRIFCLIVVSAKAIGPEDHAYVSKYSGDWTCPFTPDEQRLMDGAVSEDERMALSWRVECLPPLLWAVHRTDALPRPDRTADFQLSKRVVEEGQAALASRARLRDVAEILDAADLIYRYHWAVRDAGLRREAEPTGLHPGVVYERHRALNWLIGYQSQDWDDVSTDT